MTRQVNEESCRFRCELRRTGKAKAEMLFIETDHAFEQHMTCQQPSLGPCFSAEYLIVLESNPQL